MNASPHLCLICPLGHIPCALAHACAFIHDVLCPHTSPFIKGCTSPCMPTFSSVNACDFVHGWACVPCTSCPSCTLIHVYHATSCLHLHPTCISPGSAQPIFLVHSYSWLIHGHPDHSPMASTSMPLVSSPLCWLLHSTSIIAVSPSSPDPYIHPRWIFILIIILISHPCLIILVVILLSLSSCYPCHPVILVILSSSSSCYPHCLSSLSSIILVV